MPVTIEDIPPVLLLAAMKTSILTVVDVTTNPNAHAPWEVAHPFPTCRTPGAPFGCEEGEMVSLITTPGEEGELVSLNGVLSS